MSSFGLQNTGAELIKPELDFLRHPLTLRCRIIKRSLDLLLSIVGLISFSLIILVAYILATFSTGKNGFFFQTRVGRYGKLFRTVKIRTMRDIPEIQTSVTSAIDPRITKVGQFLRRTKIDELPQLWNVLVGEMSLVGPRPDVPGFADTLAGHDRIILMVRPGITGPATLEFRHEETLLAEQPEPEIYNRDVIYPEKVRLNRKYLEDYNVALDIMYLIRTVTGQ